ncbi:hypothetical protein DFH06DRAFT_1346657 [Mycena polygramma]|nr:hypothetical protein DFH06DRAFT_1346657 [Mycena polygramma]
MADPTTTTTAAAPLAAAAPTAVDIHDTDSETSSVVDVSFAGTDTDTDSIISGRDDDASETTAPTEGEGEAATVPRLSLGEAFELLAVAAAAVSQAVADAVILSSLAAASAAATAPPATYSFVHSTGPWVAGRLFSVVPPVDLVGVPDNGEKWYAITKGKYVGLTQNGIYSSNAVLGVSGALHGSYTQQAEALLAFNAARTGNLVVVIP